MIEPRLLTADEAAAYLSLKPAAFTRLRIGIVSLGAAVRYDRRALDAHLDRVSGLAPQSPRAANEADDPEAALDRFAARFSDAPRRP